MPKNEATHGATTDNCQVTDGEKSISGDFHEEILWESDGNDTQDMRDTDSGTAGDAEQPVATNGSEAHASRRQVDSIPIMPTSNILTEPAAKRILERTIDSDSDPVSRSIRTKRLIHDNLDGVAPDFVTRGLARMSSKAIFMASHITEQVTDMRDMRRRGRTSQDIAQLGTSFLTRLARMLSEVSEMTADGLLSDAAGSIRRAVTWLEDGYYETASMLGHEAAYGASERVRREFDSAWAWLYANVFAVDASRGTPSWTDFWDKPRASEDDIISGLGGVLLDFGKHAQGAPTTGELHALPHGELARLSALLDEFAEVTQSWPEVYGNRPLLSAEDEDWDNQQYWNLLGGIRFGDMQESTERVTEVGEDGEERVFYRAKTNKQMGLPFAAWTSDCHEASVVLGFWAREKARDETMDILRDIMTSEERAEVDRRRRQVWDWLGQYLFMVVC